jgi:hypothetical protein
MDVIDFLYASLGSGTVHLHDSLSNSRACAHSEADLWAKELNAKDIHKEIFPVYCEKCLSRKTVYNWDEKFSQGHPKVADDARPSAEVAETTVKRYLRCGFRGAGKAMGQVYQCLLEDMSRNNCFFPGSKSTCFTFYISFFHLFTDSLSKLIELFSVRCF